MSTLLVSVIIPTYNGAKYIEAAISSILAQKFTDLEIIVVDDGSTDNTAAIVGQMALLYPQIKFFSQVNGGAQVARNTGISYASGKYIAMLDQDDRWLPQFLEYMLAQLKNYPFAISDLQLINSEGQIILKRKRARLISMTLPYNLIRLGIVSPTGMVFRKSLWEQIGPFDEKLEVTGDGEWIVRATLAGAKPTGIPFPLWQYRLHETNTSRNVALMTENIGMVLDKTYSRSDLPAKVIKYKPQAYLIHYMAGAAKFYARNEPDTARDYLEKAYQIAPFHFFSLQTFITFLKVFAQVGEQDLTIVGCEAVDFVAAAGHNPGEQARLRALGLLTLGLLVVRPRPGLGLAGLLGALKAWPGVVAEPGLYHTLGSYSRIYLLEAYYRLRYKITHRFSANKSKIS